MSFASYPKGGVPAVETTDDSVQSNNSTASYTTVVDMDVSRIGGPMLVTWSCESLSRWDVDREVPVVIRVDTQDGGSWTDRSWPLSPSGYYTDSGGTDTTAYVPVSNTFYVEKADRVRFRFRTNTDTKQVNVRRVRVVAVAVSKRS